MKMKRNNNVPDFKISACTITKNEEENIAKSINSYKKVVDEIIVVDTGSTDNTVEIAKSLGAKVIHFEWINDFSAAKNTALDAATGDWIIFLDADESFVGDCAKNIKAVIAEAVSQNANIISCLMDNTDKNSGEVQNSHICFRLFKSVFRYRYPIHEDLYGESKKLAYNVPESRLRILHTGYSADIIEAKTKRNLEPMLAQMKQEKDEYRKASLCIMLADAYRSLNDYEKVYEYSKKFLEEYSQLNVPLHNYASKPYMQIIMSSMVLNKHEETEKYIKKYVGKYPNSSIALRFQGLNHYRKNEFSSAVTAFLKVLDNLDNTTHNEIKYTFKMAEIYETIAICEESLFNIEKAVHYHFLGAKEPKDYELSIANLLRLLKDKPHEYVEKVLCEILDTADSKKKKVMLFWMLRSFESRNIKLLYDLIKRKPENSYLEYEKIVSAFLSASEKEYVKAILDLLSTDSNALVPPQSAITFATLTRNPEATELLKNLCDNEELFSIGLAELNDPSNYPLDKMVNIYSLFERLDEIELAVELINKLVQKMPERVLIELAQKLTDAFCFKIPAHILEQIEKTSDVLFSLGYCYYKQKLFSEAVGCFDKVTDPRRIDAIAGMKKTMEKQLNHSIPLSAEDIKMFKAKIEEAFINANFSDAEKLIDEFNLYSKPDIDIISAKASLYYYNQDFEKALELVKEGMLLDDKCFDLLYNAGYIYKSMGDNENALKMFGLAAKHCDRSELAEEINTAISEITKS